MDQQSQPVAISMGRRIYLGNLPYTAQPNEIESLLEANGFKDLEHIHISMDPVSARNPGYCFVDFYHRETAERALSELKISFKGRPVEVGPCEPKKQRNRCVDNEDPLASKRWGNWTSKRCDLPDLEENLEYKGPNWALNHFDDMVEDQGGRRLYVGGLDKMLNQPQHQKEVTEIFDGFAPIAIGKRITPIIMERSISSHRHYCFVDFATGEHAMKARAALDGQPHDGGILKVSMAKAVPRKLVDRRMGTRDGLQVRDGGTYARQNSFLSEGRSKVSENWRRLNNQELHYD